MSIKDAHRIPTQLSQVLIQDDTAKPQVMANRTWSFLLPEQLLSQDLGSLSMEAHKLCAGAHTNESRLVAKGRWSLGEVQSR